MEHKSKRRERGQSLTELVLILPVLLILLAGVLDVGRLYYVYVAVTDAAAEGATYAAIHPNGADQIISRAQAASGTMVQIDPDLVEIDCPAAAAGVPITVTVEYTFTLVTPFVESMVPDGLTLRAVATESILAGEL
jgi:Flp pilus assembly protein TadG